MSDDNRNLDASAGLTDATGPSASRINLEQHARISADVAEGVEGEAEVLKRHGLTGEEWTEATRIWMTALAEDVQKHGAEAQLPLQYSDYFAQQQQSLRPEVTMTPEQWAELEFDIEREGSMDLPLARRQMSLADYMRIMRTYAKRITEEPAVAVRVERHRAALNAKDA